MDLISCDFLRKSLIEPCLILYTSNILDGLCFIWLFFRGTYQIFRSKILDLLSLFIRRDLGTKVGTKTKIYFSYHICYENLAKVSKVNKQTDRTKQYAPKEESIKTSNKVGTFAQDFKDWKRSKEQHIKI